MKDKYKIIHDLKVTLISKFGDNIKDVILFGSQAFGNSIKDSDYDILIIIRHKYDWRYERDISDECYKIDLKYEIITDTHIISEAELKTLRGRQPVYANAIKKGIYA